MCLIDFDRLSGSFHQHTAMHLDGHALGGAHHTPLLRAYVLAVPLQILNLPYQLVLYNLKPMLS